MEQATPDAETKEFAEETGEVTAAQKDPCFTFPCMMGSCWCATILIIAGLITTFVIIGATSDDDGTSGGGSFAAGTLVLARGGEWRRIEEVQLGEELAIGGRVTGRMEFEAAWSELMLYTPTTLPGKSLPATLGSGIVVCDGHAVWQHSGWVRVRDALSAVRLTDEQWLSLASTDNKSSKIRVFDLDVERHRLQVRASDGLGDTVDFADFSEVDQSHTLVKGFETALLASLNANELGPVVDL